MDTQNPMILKDIVSFKQEDNKTKIMITFCNLSSVVFWK